MVSKCGSEISSHIPAIVNLCLEYITYDPNYNYDDGEDSDMVWGRRTARMMRILTTTMSGLMLEISL